jgi:hypothetical protein
MTAFPAMAPAQAVRPPPVWVPHRNTAEVMAQAVKIEAVTVRREISLPAETVTSEEEDADMPLYEDLAVSERVAYGLTPSEWGSWASLD